MLSRSGVYALQAALHLAQQPRDTPVSAARMAEYLELPPEYLAKVLRRLKSEGLVTSTRGARGGYSLTSPPEEVTVESVVGTFEDVIAPRRCLLGGPCDIDEPCPAHLRRLEWNDARKQILATTKLTDLLPKVTGNGGPPALDTNGINHDNDKAIDR